MSKGKRQKSAAPLVAMSLTIDDLAAGGDGVAHPIVAGEPRAVFVPRVANGDVVDAQVDLSIRPARGRVVRLVTEGPARVAPPCTYVDACGACDWMHLSRDGQRAARESLLRRALPPEAREIPIVLHDEMPSLGARTRARLHVRVSGGRTIVGPNAVGSHTVVDVSTCLALHPSLDAALGPIAALFEGAHGTGDAYLALGAGGKPVLAVRWSGPLPAATFGRLERAVLDGAFAGGSLYEGTLERPAVIGNPAPEMTAADGEPLHLASGGFAQASEAANLTLGARVLALATSAAEPTASVLELYAGAGNFTVLLARTFARLVAVESDAAACEAARKNLVARGLSTKVTCADADTFAIPAKTDLVVLDPPRRGARELCTRLASSSVKSIVYVSCDPPTLGRDLSLLAPRFEIAAVESFAMFPGTSHAETVVLLRRRARPA